MILGRFDPLSCSLKRVHADIFMLALMNKTKDQISWVSSHDLYWENKMYKRKRSISERIIGKITVPFDFQLKFPHFWLNGRHPWFQFLREGIVAYDRHWIEIWLYLSDSTFVEFICLAKQLPIKSTNWSHSEDFTLKVSTINSSNRPTVVYNSWNKLTLNARASWLNQPEVSTLKTVSTNSLLTKNGFFCRLKYEKKTKHTRNVFWVAIAQFSHFSTHETGPFLYYNWVRLRQPSNKNTI